MLRPSFARKPGTRFATVAASGTLLALGLLAAAPALSRQMGSKSEMVAHLAAQYKVADRALNKVYQKRLADYDDDYGRVKLKKAQRAWLAFRDAEIEFRTAPFRSGTGLGAALNESGLDITRERIRELNKY